MDGCDDGQNDGRYSSIYVLGSHKQLYDLLDHLLDHYGILYGQRDKESSAEIKPDELLDELDHEMNMFSAGDWEHTVEVQRKRYQIVARRFRLWFTYIEADVKTVSNH